MSAVVLSDVYKTYSFNQKVLEVLKGISLEVTEGQIFGIIGRSGAGKSTLMRCLNGLESPDQGKIQIAGQVLTEAKGMAHQKILQKIGTVFQNFNLLSRRTVLQNIALPLEFMGASPDEITIKTRKVAELVGLGEKHHAYPAQLSGGQRQRVAIARALVADVSLLVCDEFTSALDPETSLEILSLLHNLNQRLKITVIMVTHNMFVIREICDEVCVLDQGQIVERGSVESLLLLPQHQVTRSLVRNLFMKDLPQSILEKLKTTPTPNDHAVLRLVFSDKCARQPVIASVIESFKIPVNIIAGNIDHVREVAFGSLVVTLPCTAPAAGVSRLDQIQAYFHGNDVSSEIIGFIPPQ